MVCTAALLAEFTEKKLPFWKKLSDFIVLSGEKIVKRLYKILRRRDRAEDRLPDAD